ncbi:hypothetical protein BH20VER3_BH20VER3_03920 [soil metagenome]
MNSLRKVDWLRLQEFLLRLHTVASLAQLPATILGGLRDVIPYDSGSLQDDRGGLRKIPWLYEEEAWQPVADPAGELGVRMMSHWAPEFTSMREAFFAASAERHPHSAYYQRTGDGAARRLSEIISTRALQRTVFYNEISRKNRLVRQLTIYLPMPPAHTAIIALCREAPDFCERDRDLLELLRPHIGSAWRQAWERERDRAELRRLKRPGTRRGVSEIAAVTQRCFALAPREAQVLGWVTQGKTNGEIAIILGLAPGTVKFYVERILAKLGCETRTGAAHTALEAMDRN